MKFLDDVLDEKSSSTTKYTSLEDDALDDARSDPYERQPKRTRSTALFVCLCISIFLATAVIVATAIVSRLFDLHHVRHCSVIPLTESAYGRDLKYASIDHRYDHLWDIYTDEFVIGVPNGDEDEPQPAVITMIHQLHCLTSLRKAIQSAHEGKAVGIDWRDNPHWPHCLDYLRKSILCAADGTLERETVFINGTGTGFIDGSQDVRQCGNSQALFKLMQEAQPGSSLPKR